MLAAAAARETSVAPVGRAASVARAPTRLGTSTSRHSRSPSPAAVVACTWHICGRCGGSSRRWRAHSSGARVFPRATAARSSPRTSTCSHWARWAAPVATAAPDTTSSRRIRVWCRPFRTSCPNPWARTRSCRTARSQGGEGTSMRGQAWGAVTHTHTQYRAARALSLRVRHCFSEVRDTYGPLIAPSLTSAPAHCGGQQQERDQSAGG